MSSSLVLNTTTIAALTRDAILPLTSGKNFYDGRELDRFVADVIAQHRDALERVVVEFKDCGTFPHIPFAHLFDGGDTLPDLWIMGWRHRGCVVSPEATTIHDHGPSNASIHIVRGMVREVHYKIDVPMWRLGRENIAANRGTSITMVAGRSYNIRVPYVHRMTLEHDSDAGFSVHGYFPPLKRQRSFALVNDHGNGAILYGNGGWPE